MQKQNEDFSIQFNIKKFKNLSDVEIQEKFNKAILPEILKQVRKDFSVEECPVCNPWSYAVF